MGQAEYQPGEDERALLELLPADGSALDSSQIRNRLDWDAERYAHACARLDEQGYVLAGHGHSEDICRDLTAIPPEFRPACGRPGSHVIVRQVPVTIPHALCDLTGVRLSYPRHGGAITPRPGHGIGSSLGFQVEVNRLTLDVTIRVRGLERHPHSTTGPDV
jgi:hypothetical protein